MRNEEILVKLGTLIETSEKIEEVSYYTNPLNNLQLYKGAVKPTGFGHLVGHPASRVHRLQNAELVVVHREKRHRNHHSAVEANQIRS